MVGNMAITKFDLDWSDIAFQSKQPINKLNAVFINAPREMSLKRITQLIKTHLPKGNIIVGISKEPYVNGLEQQAQFKMLDYADVSKIIDKVNKSGSKHKIYTLRYFQREFKYLLEKLSFKSVILVNGSWYTAFHLRPEYYILTNQQVNHEFVSPFSSEAEARGYADGIRLPQVPKAGLFTEREMLDLTLLVARHSFDYGGFQTAAALGLKHGNKHKLLATAHNRVVPYETYAMHHGASRERNFSPPHDLNHYDTVHAEVELLIAAQRKSVSLKGSTLFINLLPCPTCGRMLVETDVEEVVYQNDHSSGYTFDMLSIAGKKIRRITSK